MTRSATTRPWRIVLVATLVLMLGVAVSITQGSGLESSSTLQVKSTVVSIWPSPEGCRVHGTGTGFFFTPQGHILTADHVVRNIRAEVGDKVWVQWAPTERAEEARSFWATVVAEAPEAEAAVLLAETQGDVFPYPRLGNSDAVVGAVREGKVVAVTMYGFPEPKEKGCLVIDNSRGIIRAVVPADQLPPELQRQFPQYTASSFRVSVSQVFPGSSGSPLVHDETEEIIGVLFSGRRDIEEYYVFPINEAINILSENWLQQKGSLPPYVLGIVSLKFAEKIIADGQPVASEMEFWALRGDLRRVRIQVLKGEDLILQPTDTRVHSDPAKPSYRQGDQLDLVVEPVVRAQREGVIGLTIATKTPQEAIQLRFSLIDAAGNGSEPQELTFSAVPPLQVLADFEGTECSLRRGKHLIGFGSFYTPGKGFQIEACMRDPVDPDNRGNVVREEYNVDEKDFPRVSRYDLYVGFWLHWEVEDFNPKNYEKLCVWLRGGDKEAGLGYTTRVKVELKIREWERWGWRITYLEGITDQWQQFCIPLEDFIPFGVWPPPDDPEKPNEFVITFENREVTEKKGVLWIDEIALTVKPENPSTPALAASEQGNGDGELLDLVQRHTFLFFWEQTDERGFTIESTAWPIGSIASSGFLLTSIPIAIERRWVGYEEGRDRVLTTLRSYADFVESEHGFFPHWFIQSSGRWTGADVFSSIDTAILMAGVLTVRQYFAGLEGEPEQEIVKLATELYEAVDWDWMTDGWCTLTMGWRPDTGFHHARWIGYNEGMLAVLLALGSPTRPISKARCSNPWQDWARIYRQMEYTHDDQIYRFIESTSTSLFTYQYPQIWFDLREKTDSLGIDYFENSRIATLENRAYCIENPHNHQGYGPNLWGLTASECPLHDTNYGAHGPRQDDDGTIAPTGAISSIVFTPEESIAALQYMYDTFKAKLWGRYGFRDAFNLNIDWFSPTYIGIDQGAILTMIENHRSGLVWSLFMQNEYVKRALEEAGFTGKDTTPPAIVHGPFLEAGSGAIMAKVEDNVGVHSVVLYYDDKAVEMTKDGSIYSAAIPADVSRYRLEARDVNGNLAVAEYDRSQPPWVETVPELSARLPGEASPGSLLIENFDDCIARHLIRAWHGGASRPWDALVMFDGTVNHGETGCSLKIAYNVQPGKFNGSLIKLDGLDLREYKKLVFWVQGDNEKGYTRTFKIELKSPNGAAEYVVEGVTGSWQRMAIHLNRFTPSGIDWSDVTEFTIVFEDWRATDKEGAIYIDDIYFEP